MAETQGTRRSGRARKAVTTYAEEQAEQQSTDVAVSVKRKKPTAKAATSRSKGASTDSAFPKPDSANGEGPEPPRKKTKKSQAIGEEDNTDPDLDAPQDDGDFKPALKKAKKKRTVPIGKLDSEGVMRLDTTEQRPKGEKKTAQVYAIPAKPKGVKGEKGKPTINLAAILAESFEDRWERKVSKIPRLQPGAPEVRLKQDVSYMTDSYKTFLERASTQRMFVLSRTQGYEENCHAHDKECPIHQIKIAGSTGNVYTVIISHLPTCSCPNTSFKRNDSGQALCKHVLYVLYYALKVPEHLRHQNAFLTSELKEITANAPALPTAVIEKEETHDGNRKPVEDDCPICCVEFSKDDKVTWCRAACGNNIHQDCFDLWAQTRKPNPTCPYCRTLWQDDKPAKSGEQSETLVDVKMTQHTGGYFNVRDQLEYD